MRSSIMTRIVLLCLAQRYTALANVGITALCASWLCTKKALDVSNFYFYSLKMGNWKVGLPVENWLNGAETAPFRSGDDASNWEAVDPLFLLVGRKGRPRQFRLIGEGVGRLASSRPASLSVSQGAIGISLLFLCLQVDRLDGVPVT